MVSNTSCIVMFIFPSGANSIFAFNPKIPPSENILEHYISSNFVQKKSSNIGQFLRYSSNLVQKNLAVILPFDFRPLIHPLLQLPSPALSRWCPVLRRTLSVASSRTRNDAWPISAEALGHGSQRQPGWRIINDVPLVAWVYTRVKKYIYIHTNL